jgi:hypothetical protein
VKKALFTFAVCAVIAQLIALSLTGALSLSVFVGTGIGWSIGQLITEYTGRNKK